MPLTHDDLFRPFHDAMKPRSAWRIGAEAEKFGVDARTFAPIPYEGERGVVAILHGLEARHGWKATFEVEGGPLIALERGGASVTLEPGGQLELSGAPLEDIHQICHEMHDHLTEVRSIGDALGLEWLGVGFHPFARQADLSWVPKLRYEVMKTYLPTRGTGGLDMMRRTATVQANFDYDSEEDALRKLRVGLKLSPLVTAMLANSPFVEGKLTGERSHRARVWLDVDPSRQGLLPQLWSESSTLRDYVDWALDAPMFLVKRGATVVHNTGQTFRSFWQDGFEGHRAEAKDWETHLNTLFPEVRLKKTLEVRGADSLPHRLACALPALWTGIYYDERALAEAEALVADWTFEEQQALRPEIAAKALRATFRGLPLADVASRLLDIAKGGLARRARMSAQGNDESVHLVRLAGLVEHAMSPADALVVGLTNDTPDLGQQILERARI
jgi:glutamate--cysteine ligase